MLAGTGVAATAATPGRVPPTHPLATSLNAADLAKAYVAAGLTVKGSDVTGCVKDQPAAPPSRFRAERIDLNADGRPEALVTEYNASCFGTAGASFTIVGQAVTGRWRRLGGSTGTARVLATRHLGWVDIAVQAPGDDKPAQLRWTGTRYQ